MNLVQKICRIRQTHLPLDEQKRGVLVSQTISMSVMLRDVICLAVRDNPKAFRDMVGGEVVEPMDVINEVTKSLPNGISCREDMRVLLDFLNNYLPKQFSQEKVDQWLLESAVLNGLDFTDDGFLIMGNQLVEKGEKEEYIFGHRIDGRKPLSAEEAKDILTRDPFSYINIFKESPPKKFIDAFASRLCMFMRSHCLYPDLEKGWTEVPISEEESKTIVTGLMESGDLNNNLIATLSKFMSDRERAEIFVQSLYEDCNGYLVKDETNALQAIIS